MSKTNPSFEDLSRHIKQLCPDALLFESQRDGHILIDTKMCYPYIDDGEELGIRLLPLKKV